MVERKLKCHLILSSLAIAVGIAGLRAQKPTLYIAGIGACLYLIYWRSWPSFISTAVLLVMALPQASFNTLYGFDTHSPSIVAQEILQSGWPILNIELSWGYTGTPLLHIHAGMVSLISGLPLIPSVGSQVLVGSLLPIIYVLCTLLFTYALARRYTDSKILAIAPLLFWVPFYIWKVPFSRQSLGIVLFMMGVWAVHRTFQNQSRRLAGLLVLTSTAIVTAHHLSAAFLWFFLAAAVLATRLSQDKKYRPQLIKPLLIMTLVFVLWFALAELQGGRFVIIVVSIFSKLSVISGPTVIPDWLLRYQIEYSQLFRVKKIYSLWTFQVLLAVPILALSVVQVRRKELSANILVTLFFGAIAGGLAVVAMLAPVLDVARSMTYFVVAGGWISIKCWRKFDGILSRTRQHQLASGVVAACIILGVIMMPVYAISSASPNYEDMGQKDEKFTDEAYASITWVNTHTTGTVFGDSLVQEAMIPLTQREVEAGFSELVVNGSSGNKPVVIAERNQYIYFGSFQGETIIIDSKPIQNSVRDSGKPYTNGDYEVYI